MCSRFPGRYLCTSTPPHWIFLSVSSMKTHYMVYANSENLKCFECGDVGDIRGWRVRTDRWYRYLSWWREVWGSALNPLALNPNQYSRATQVVAERHGFGFEVETELELELELG